MADKDDRRFRRDYGKAIAEALKEKERSGRTTFSKEELADRAYVALCHDDPRVEGDEACRFLAEALLSSNSSYALSERLVEGIRQATSKVMLPQPKDKEEAAGGNDVDDSKRSRDDDADHSSVQQDLDFSALGSATAVGYARLALATFVEIPLKCCQSKDKSEIQRILGSYIGPVRSMDAIAENERYNEIQEETRSDNRQASENTDQQNVSASHDVVEPYAEVWAEESDPSDFCYDDGAADAVDWTAWADSLSFKPVDLSKPLDRDLDELRSAAGNLLRDLNYQKLAPLMMASTSQRRQTTSILTQLCLTLMLPSSSCPFVDESIQQYGVHPLHIFHDMFVSLQNHEQRDATLLKEFLVLLQSLIAVDSALSDVSKHDEIAPATIVGVSSLSSLCGMAKQLKETRTIRQFILDNCDDLCRFVERIRESPHEQQQRNHLILALLPLLDLLSNIQSDGSRLDASLQRTSKLVAKDAQWLLNSGLFRELVLLASEEKKSNDVVQSPAELMAQHHLIQSLQYLSLESMNLLGKYAWRVPNLNQRICSEQYAGECKMDYLVWQLMGTELAAGSMLRKKNAPLVTVATCLNGFRKSLVTMSERVVGCLNEVGRRRRQQQEQQKSNKKENDDKAWLRPILDLQRFTNLLTSSSQLARLWKVHVTNDVLDDLLKPIRTSLASLPPVPEKNPAVTGKSAENDKESPADLERPYLTFEEEVGLVRKSVKILALAMQEVQGGASQAMSSKTD